MKKPLFLKGLMVLLSLILYQTVISQVAINESGDDAADCAILDVNHTSKGLLVPRVSLVAVNSSEPVSNPVPGLIVFNSGTALPKGLYCWTGDSWEESSGSSQGGVTPTYGELYETNSSGTDLDIDKDDWTGWTTAEQGFSEGDITFDTENTTASRITVNSPGFYKVTVSCTFYSEDRQTVIGSVFKEGFEFGKISFREMLKCTEEDDGDATRDDEDCDNELNVSASGIMEFDTGEYIDLRFKSSKNNKEIELKVVNMSIIKISDASP